jgi:CelD/BcsL family acetyltransferase involved in cellulose biosynthesis
MTAPLLLTETFHGALPARAAVVDGLSAAIDGVAGAAPDTHRFLTYGWFAAAVSAYGGHPRTLLVERGEAPVLAMPLVAIGPGAAKLVTVPGSYWPFRSFPVAVEAGADVAAAALNALAGVVNGVRLGPVYDGDPGASALIAAARAGGWAVLDRFVAQSWLLDMAALRAEGAWPRGSTLRKNRFHEKHLGDHGALDWRFVTGADWPAAFDALAEVEEASWIAARTDGSDAKFTRTGHGAFWRAAAADPLVAGMLRAALLTVDGKPAAFSFDLDAGDLKYAIANSYDPAIGKHSPGKLLQYRDLVDGLDRGIARVDWGAGDSGYKQTIGAEEGPTIRDWLLLRPGLPAIAGRLARGLWRRSGNPEPVKATG